MIDLLNRLRKNRFRAYLTAILLMLLPAGLLYLVAQRGADDWIAGLLIPIILGNLLAMIVD